MYIKSKSYLTSSIADASCSKSGLSGRGPLCGWPVADTWSTKPTMFWPKFLNKNNKK